MIDGWGLTKKDSRERRWGIEGGRGGVGIHMSRRRVSVCIEGGPRHVCGGMTRLSQEHRGSG